ncbi:group 1 truncated hemoglobin [Brevundimonas sp.]|uniref:group I truncated hemoglobin n=1 Tax=Brevundimonas sp. TaxID=1871086 RepID=UPI002BF840E1|nr:group 1 truncated hemoglobin [Brevundimonas sp.]HWQ88149.1 group 1 truncated hemoglobin [Brevundimonas sp.]
MSTQEDQPGTEPATAGEPTANRRDLVARGALTLSAAAIAATLPAGCARADDPAPMPEKQDAAPSGPSLYERLGGIFAIAGVVDYFSDEIIKDPVAGARSRNPALRQWHTAQLGRLPGLKFMRTLWVAAVSGGPYEYTPTKPGSTNLGLEEAHRNLRISSEEFDAVAGVLSRSLDHFDVPEREKSEVLAAFAAHKTEVTQGSRAAR